MVTFYMKWKKYNEILLTKNKMDLNNRKMKNNTGLARARGLPFPRSLLPEAVNELSS